MCNVNWVKLGGDNRVCQITKGVLNYEFFIRAFKTSQNKS